MSERIGWDKYEIALLIDACERVLSGQDEKPTLVKYLSAKLRERAISRGIVIDDIFRNENGISLQMTKMDYVLTDGKKGLPGASRYYIEIATLKASHPLAFNEILTEAKRQIGEGGGKAAVVENLKDLFKAWLEKQGKLKMPVAMVISVLEESSEYAVKRSITKKSIWEISDRETLTKLYRKLSENRVFRFTKRQIAKALDSAYIYYRDFLIDYQASAIKDMQPPPAPVDETPAPKMLSNGPLRTIVEKILNEYIGARKEVFAGHTMGLFFRNEIPKTIYATGIVNEETHLITGSVGQGNWAFVPWVCIFNRSVTLSATKGVYIVYLLAKDGKTLYLTFNQGCTDIRKSHTKVDTIAIMRKKAADVVARLDSRGFASDEKIDLGSELTELAELYQKGTIFYKAYSCGEVPSEEELQDDLRKMMDIYRDYVTVNPVEKDDSSSVVADPSNGEAPILVEKAAYEVPDVSSAERNFMVDFSGNQSYAFTYPVKLRYFDKEIVGLGNWTNLYTTLVGLLYADHPDVFVPGMNFARSSGTRMEVASQENKTQLLAPRAIPGTNLYIETNLSATVIVEKIEAIMALCHVGLQNLVIFYNVKAGKQKVAVDSSEVKTEEVNVPVAPGKLSFEQWLKNKGLFQAAVDGYVASIRKASEYAEKNNIPGVDLYSSDPAVVQQSIDILLVHHGFIQYNQDEHRRFTGAFRQLRDYCIDLARAANRSTNDHAYATADSVLYEKLSAVSKVYDEPRGITVERIIDIIGASSNDRYKITTILDGVTWATKISDGVYSFAAQPLMEAPIPEETVVVESTPDDFDKEAFIRVLMTRYRNGMEFDSIDLENFRDTYQDLFDDTLEFSDAELEKRIRLCGVFYADRLFPAEGIIDRATSERLFTYIENKFATGSKVLYYKAIFTDLADAFVYCFTLRDESMLKAYIEYTAEEGKYYFHDDFMSTEENVKIDHAAEIIEYMLTAGKPLSYDEVYAGLSHIAQDIIYREIHWNPVFVLNEKEHYFHIDIFEFSQAESDKISEIISREIENDGYAIWSRIYGTVAEQLPIFLENNLYLSPLGLRNALSRKMDELYHFDGEVISSKDAALGMGDVYRLYAMHHAPFSDTDVYDFSKEIGTNIYLWHLGEGATRVSKNLFVAKDQVHFDVEAVDKALETYLTSGYILIKDVDSFLVFPNVGYEWNEFLLESFLIYHSKKFVLVNNGTSLNNVAGAIALKDGAYTEFVDICAHVLAESGIELKKSVALNYLAEINLITRRSYKDIDVAMTKARQIRNRKG